LPPEEARKILGKKAIIGFSTAQFESSRPCCRLPIDYIAVGPVFDTKTKENPDKTVGLETIKSIRKEIGNFPLVAIGGINLFNFREVIDAGADSAAVISDLLSKPDEISQKVKNFLSETQLVKQS
jgi:thiamine-phosphate pyrophosphorylase